MVRCSLAISHCFSEMGGRDFFIAG
jgi:hypothetical protein